MSTTTTMTDGATESMKREVEFICDVHGVTDETMIADIEAMFRSAYEWGRIAVQCEQFTAQVDEFFTAMAAIR
jgi:hypothetical protein